MKHFKIFCGSTKLIPLCINDVLLSDGAAYRKWRHNIVTLYLTPFPVFCTFETASQIYKLTLSEIKTKFQSSPRLIFKERRINTIQIVDILNSPENWVIKWLVHRKKGTLTTKLQANAKLFSNSLKITQIFLSKEVVQLHET